MQREDATKRERPRAEANFSRWPPFSAALFFLDIYHSIAVSGVDVERRGCLAENFVGQHLP